jgi:hypothetical protein
MFLIGEYILDCPFNSFIEGMLAYRAIAFKTDRTLEILATIGVNK